MGRSVKYEIRSMKFQEKLSNSDGRAADKMDTSCGPNLATRRRDYGCLHLLKITALDGGMRCSRFDVFFRDMGNCGKFRDICDSRQPPNPDRPICFAPRFAALMRDLRHTESETSLRGKGINEGRGTGPKGST